MLPIERKLTFQGLSVAVETDAGQYRHWYDPNGKEKGKTLQHYPYGYFVGTLGLDGDAVDVYVGNREDSSRVFVITQMKTPDFEQIDEQKVMIGFNDPVDAKTAYLLHFDNARFFGSMQEMSVTELKLKLKTKHGELIKSTTLLNVMESVKMINNNMLFLDLNKAQKEFKPVSLNSSSVGSKTTYTNKAQECALKDEDLDMEKSPKEAKEAVGTVSKALKAAAITGLARKERINAMYQLGLSQGRKDLPIKLETAEIPQEELNIGITKAQLRPTHEPPVVPVRKIATTEFITPKKCGDHTYTAVPVGPQEAKSRWSR